MKSLVFLISLPDSVQYSTILREGALRANRLLAWMSSGQHSHGCGSDAVMEVEHYCVCVDVYSTL